MISVIICSRHKEANKSLLHNIEKTIGTEYEVVWIDNSMNEFGMCAAYNEGVRRSKGDYLCFMHDDVDFLSNEWGRVAIDDLNDVTVGLIGIVGSTFYDLNTIYWWQTPYQIGHHWNGKNHKIISSKLQKQDVVVVDGMFLFTKKLFFENGIIWDEKTFRDFDMYDMDISMQFLRSGKRLLIEPSIHINHASEGNYTHKFYVNVRKFHEKWDGLLPITCENDLNECIGNNSRFILDRLCNLEEENTSNKKVTALKLYKAIVKVLGVFKSINDCFVNRLNLTKTK